MSLAANAGMPGEGGILARGRVQFSDGGSALSITTNSPGPVAGESFRPSSFWRAVKIDGPHLSGSPKISNGLQAPINGPQADAARDALALFSGLVRSGGHRAYVLASRIDG